MRVFNIRRRFFDFSRCASGSAQNDTLKVIFVNFKTYQQTTGENAVKLARACEKAQKNIKVPIHLLVQSSDIAQVKDKVNLSVWAQHIDPVESGQTTGFTTALAVKKGGVEGTILNHSEHPLNPENLRKAVKLAKDQGLKTLVCVKSVEEAKRVRNLDSDFVALEDPQLVGTGVSMMTSEEGQRELAEFVKLGFSFSMVGAGISTREDVKKSVEIGAKGVLVSSAIVKAKDPQRVIEELAVGFKL